MSVDTTTTVDIRTVRRTDDRIDVVATARLALAATLLADDSTADDTTDEEGNR